MNLSTKLPAQLSLEAVIQKNKAEAEQLKKAAEDKLAENARIEAEMNKILSEPPPASRLVDAFQQGVNAIPPPSMGTRMAAEKEVLYAALAIVRSWQRRHKKTFHAQEKELMNAVERLTWEQ